MKSLKVGAVCGLLLAACAYGVAYKDGKEVMDKTYKVDVLKMQWGTSDRATDRLTGTVRVYLEQDEDPYQGITLVFDVFSRKASTNEVRETATGQRKSPKAEKIDTIEAAFDFHKFGYKRARNYIEGEFCFDFDKKADAARLQLSSVRLKGESVTYVTTFNMNSSLLKTNFKIAEPKVVPVKM